MANLGAVLTTSQYATPADYLGSANGLFFAIMQADGNFCVYRGSSPTDSEGLLWDSGTTRSGGEFFAIMQADGNFVIYAGTGPSNNLGFVWSSSGSSQPQGSYFAILQNDGNFCVYKGTGPGDNQGLVWNSGATVQSDSDLQTAATDSGSVTCTLSTGLQVDLIAVLAAAQGVNSSLTTSSPIILIAYGATGGQGKGYDETKPSPGGEGGQAQMTLSVESFAKAYNGTTLYFLFGSQGSTEHWGGKGGSSTIVSTVSFFSNDMNSSSVTPSTANVLLCAGGGGGASAGSNDLPGRPGGAGGSATSSFGKAASGAGLLGGWDPVGGAGGSDGIGGAGGSANGSKNIVGGGAGTDGFGGFGGPVHISDGPSQPTFWKDLPYSLDDTTAPGWVFPMVLGGQGGEGEGRGGTDDYIAPDGAMIAEGGGGGGGYGGGGGGAGGVDQDNPTVPTEEGGGGGGGGSYAAASTINSVAPPYSVPSTNPGDGYVLFIFP